MKLSKRGRYALRALVYLSLNSDKEKMTLSKNSAGYHPYR